jgi:hypothetical protein
MKYVRNKTGVYEQYKCILNGWNFVFETKVKEADTIEELCDEFVVVYDKSEQCDNEVFNATNYTPIEACNFYNNIKIESLYGAIWTSKGLIYVAKMNDKGELELI